LAAASRGAAVFFCPPEPQTVSLLAGQAPERADVNHSFRLRRIACQQLHEGAGMHKMKLIDYGERLFLVLLSSTFLQAIFVNAPKHPYLLLLAISEILPVVLILIRRPGEMSLKPFAFVVAFLGTAAPLLVRPSQAGLSLLPDSIAAALIGTGLAINIASKLSLWRSFGLAPANRGIRAGGPYRLVRHPMYLGYFISQLGFLLANLTIGNAVKYLLAWSMQLLRIREEEKFLLQDESYQDLTRRVRFRLLPGVY
jgi:protein-S-isoprenylcysteine O-methyltransferase Ste14